MILEIVGWVLCILVMGVPTAFVLFVLWDGLSGAFRGTGPTADRQYRERQRYDPF
jgi:hypothetical protein